MCSECCKLPSLHTQLQLRCRASSQQKGQHTQHNTASSWPKQGHTPVAHLKIGAASLPRCLGAPAPQSGSAMTVRVRLSASARARMTCTSTGGYRCSSFMQQAKSPCSGEPRGAHASGSVS